MDSSKSPRNRGPNVSVRFDLAQFTERLFATVGAGCQFKGPGPAQLSWLSAHSTRVERFAVTYLADEMFSKYDDGLPSEEKRAAAIRKFREGERHCALTNFKFGPNQAGQPPAWLEVRGNLQEGFSQEDSAVFNLAKRFISTALGPFPGWERIVELADFGPGATTRLSRRDGDRSNKWGGSPHATPSAAHILDATLGEDPLVKARLGDTRSVCEITDGNNVGWVPKNYKIDRTIATEPDWNMFLQKGIGTYIRRQLKKFGQDLDDQGVNRFLAAVGSIDGTVACLDLSMASDMIAYRLAEFLIRSDWFAAIEQVRSPIGFYFHDGEMHCVIYEKLSSMGNGATFEIETLIFWGILRAVSELCGESDHRTYVYGDDIVIPTGMAELAMTYLTKAGFVVNRDKSSWSGPFRESCGGHYFDGSDVTPFYVREPVDCLDRLFLLHNNVFRWFNRHPGICSPTAVRQLLEWIRGFAPIDWQKPRLLSEEVGDGGFIGSFDEVLPTPIGKGRKYAGWEGWRVETLQYRKKRNDKNPGRQKRTRHPSYRVGSGPDLASLWALERNASWRAPRWHQRGKWLGWRNSKSFLDRLFPASAGTEIPHSERWWYTAVQVLPFEMGTSWWFC